MFSKRKLKIIMTAFFCLTLFVSLSMVAQATGKTQNEAVSWACARGDEHWDQNYDGWGAEYGTQCVDLIVAYYDYLEGWHTSGNAINYASNTLPSGWQRVYSNPKPGDIIVFNPNAVMQNNPRRYADATYGHIGIIWRVNSSGTVSTIETNGDIDGYGGTIHYAQYYERITSGAACYIRPNFSSASTPGTSVQNEWTVGAVDARETNAIVSVKYTLPSAVQFQWAGCNFFDINGNEVAKAGAVTSIYSSYVNINYDINAETHTNYVLSPGTTYKYQFYVTYGSVDHFSPMYTFRTKDHSYTSSKKNATCTASGSITYKCSGCGYSYTDTIPATGHNWDNGVVTAAATTAKSGIKTYTCKVCKATKTEVIPAIPAAGGNNNSGTSGKPQQPQTQNSQQNAGNPSGSQQSAQGNLSAHQPTGTVFNYAGLGRLKVTGAGSVELVKPSGNGKTLIVPDTITWNRVSYKVTSIAANAFKNNKKLRKITLGKNIKKIGANAFYHCSKLSTITIPASVISIGKQAFCKCSKLKNITINTRKLTKSRVGKKAFSGINKRAMFKIASSKVSAYKKLLKTKGAPKTAKYNSPQAAGKPKLPSTIKLSFEEDANLEYFQKFSGKGIKGKKVELSDLSYDKTLIDVWTENLYGGIPILGIYSKKPGQTMLRFKASFGKGKKYSYNIKVIVSKYK